jgi:hypothetical protein
VGVTDAISIGGVNLSDPQAYVAGMPNDAFRKLRERAPVAWHPYKDGPGFLAHTGYYEVLAVSRDSTMLVVRDGSRHSADPTCGTPAKENRDDQ